MIAIRIVFLLRVLHTAIRVHTAVTIILYTMHAFTIAVTNSERKFDAATTSINDCSCHTEPITRQFTQLLANHDAAFKAHRDTIWHVYTVIFKLGEVALAEI